jgi:hypothetical protein
LNLACDWPFEKYVKPVWEINITVANSRLSFLSPRKEPLEPGYTYNPAVKWCISSLMGKNITGIQSRGIRTMIIEGLSSNLYLNEKLFLMLLEKITKKMQLSINDALKLTSHLQQYI